MTKDKGFKTNFCPKCGEKRLEGKAFCKCGLLWAGYDQQENSEPSSGYPVKKTNRFQKFLFHEFYLVRLARKILKK